MKIELLSPEETAIDVFKNLTDAGEEVWEKHLNTMEKQREWRMPVRITVLNGI